MSQTQTSDAGGRTTGNAEIREEATLEIVSRVADVKGCKPWELEPLSKVTDPDAIEELVRCSSDVQFEIGFDYEGGRVTVESDGGVTYEYPTETPA
ncbi:HalOD1 output domain-containing protein [Halogeometricum limi]|uniref:Halobacterial output domain-containing protein n=1 Tax=Halogeometricum limi TaxID=555875 RepID=A0A1I6IAG5_9EURY|nr:HalOD1 output domain-containing protein [Halogeometricum limi]SFR63628.1 hypothetical protein SAMN04488124_2931 [Halogeometricum limi]